MLHINRKIKKRSINSIIIKISLIVLCPITLVTLSGNYYCQRILLQQAADYNRGTLSLHMETVDTELDNLSRSMFMILYQSLNISRLLQGKDSDARIDELLNIKTTLAGYFNAYDNADGLFLFSPATKDYIQSTSGKESIQDRTKLKKYIKNVIISSDYLDKLEGVWHPIQINRKYLLIKVIKKNEVYLGSWIWADSLMEPLKNLEATSGTSFFITDNGNSPLSGQNLLIEENLKITNSALSKFQFGSRHKYIIIGIPSSTGNFRFFMVIPYHLVIQNTIFIEKLILIVYFFTLLLLAVIFFQIQSQVIKPMNALKNGMLEIKNGNFNVLLAVPKETAEISAMTDVFNDMAKDIECLKIKVYEEQLEKTKTHLHYLNLQIKPHFFLNSLNIIYSLALTRDYKLIMDLSKCLTDYFRYIFKSSDSMVLIQEELRHINNYLHIQELRYTTSFYTNLDIEAGLDFTCIPILLIHTFVENSIKHAYTGKALLVVDIKAARGKDDFDPNLEIVISDNGCGFSKEQLKELNTPVVITEVREEHLGILNIKQRLSLIYQDKASLQFNNNHYGGAVVTIRIPLETGRPALALT